MFAKRPRVEDPARISRFTAAIAPLKWTPADYQASLNLLFQEISALAQAEIQYYYERRCGSRKLSKFCRFVAWLLATVGLLTPLLHPILGLEAPKTFLWWGYTAFGLAGAVLVADSLFAGTQAHHRYTKTQLDIEQLYSAFVMNWQAGRIKLEENPAPEAAVSLLKLAEAFSDAFHKAMGTETADWKKDVTDGLNELRGKIIAGNKGD